MKKLLLLLLFCLIAASSAIAESPFLPLAEGKWSPLPIDLSPGEMPREDGYLSDTVYVDASLSVRIEEYEVSGTRVLAAYVRVADPSQLRSAPAYDFRRAQLDTAENMAARVHAPIAINGDYYTFWQKTRGGFMIRQGETYHRGGIEGRDVLLIDDLGNFHIYTDITRDIIRAEADALEASGRKIINSFNFGPALIVDGEQTIKRYRASFCQSNEKNQRAAICQMKTDETDYVLVVCEGLWVKPDTGLTIREWADFIASLGVEQAYNLDGGNSTALLFRGEKLNEPGNPHHRQQSDIIYFASADTTGE